MPCLLTLEQQIERRRARHQSVRPLLEARTKQLHRDLRVQCSSPVHEQLAREIAGDRTFVTIGEAAEKVMRHARVRRHG